MPRGLAPRILYSLKFEEFLHYNRIEKWTLLVMIAFVWCYKTGIFIYENVKKIKIKHGRKANSIFKCGLS